MIINSMKTDGQTHCINTISGELSALIYDATKGLSRLQNKTKRYQFWKRIFFLIWDGWQGWKISVSRMYFIHAWKCEKANLINKIEKQRGSIVECLQTATLLLLLLCREFGLGIMGNYKYSLNTASATRELELPGRKVDVFLQEV